MFGAVKDFEPIVEQLVKVGEDKIDQLLAIPY